MTDDTTEPRTVATHVVGDGDDAITYDIRGDLADVTPDRPALFLFATPMEAAAFGALAEHFTDRPVVTYDPRGAGRNPTGTTDITLDQHVDDLHRVISALGAGPVDAFGSSGGGVSLLALAATHPDDLRRVVVHEPATAAPLPDRDAVLAVVRDLKQTYATQGEGAAMAKFIQFVMLQGPVPEGYLDQPAPDPATFGMPAEDDGSRTNPLFRSMPSTNEYEVDAAALREYGDRLVLAVGAESADEMPARAARAVAGQLGLPATEFPSHHAGFTNEGGYPGDPTAFAATLREVLG